MRAVDFSGICTPAEDHIPCAGDGILGFVAGFFLTAGKLGTAGGGLRGLGGIQQGHALEGDHRGAGFGIPDIQIAQNGRQRFPLV